MNRTYKWLILGMMALLFAGCSIAHTIVTPSYTKPDAAHITVYRKAIFMGGGVELYLEIDDEVVCGLWEGKSIDFPIAPGKYRLTISNAAGQSGVRKTVIFEAGKSYYVSMKAAFSNGGSFTVIEK